MSITRRSTLFLGLAAALTRSTAMSAVPPQQEMKPAEPEIKSDKVPYGTAFLRDSNPSQLTRSIADQLQQAGLKIPSLKLFEEASPWLDRMLNKADRVSLSVNSALGMTDFPLEGKMIPPGKTAFHRLFGLDDDFQVVGIESQETGTGFVDRIVKDPSKNRVLDTLCQCGKSHNEMERLYPEFRVFAALHETAHYVNARRGYNTDIAREIEVKEPNVKNKDYLLAINVNERLADAAATLYILSNYGDGRDLIKMVENYRNSSSEPSHYTASTISKAVEAFDAHPRHHLSIVEATDMAADIIRKSPGIALELAQASETYDALLKGTADPETPVMRKAVLGRRALFPDISPPKG